MMRRLLVLMALGFGLWPPVANAMTEVHLENGLRFLYDVRPASGLIASAVLVSAGAEHETPATNGAAHFLEHLLFNGTESRTREELARDFDLIGAYSNATTRRDHVAYLVVVGGEDLERALELQADMLFHATLPADEFDKERNIILEEIAKDATAPGSSTEQALIELLGELPVLGTPASIAGLSREQVFDYYRRYYVPDNMTLIVLGDFVPAGLVAAVERSFGAKVQKDVVQGGAHWGPAMTFCGRFQRPLPNDQIELRLRISAGWTAYEMPLPPLILLVELLNSEPAGLAAALRAEPEITGVEAAASLHVEAARTWLEIGAACDTTAQVMDVHSRLVEALRALAAEVPEEALAAARTRCEVAAALAHDEIHYVAFTRADRILHARLAAWADEASAIAATDRAAVERAAEALLSERAVLVAVGPGLAPVADQRNPLELVAQGSRPAAPQEALGGAPDHAVTSSALAAPSDWRRVTTSHPPLQKTFPNGLTAIVASSPESEVFAIHLLARGRTFCEPSGKSGLADLLHRVLPYGAGGRSRAELGRELDRSGIRLKLTDDPRIPYDDYQTQQTSSFIRLETVDRFGPQAITLLAAMVEEPDLFGSVLSEVQRQAVLDAERRAASPAEQSLNLLRLELYGNSPGARPALGAMADLKSITHDDLTAFHRRYFVPANLILGIVTGIEPEAVLAQIGATWGESLGESSPSDPARRELHCASPAAMRPEPTAAPGRRETVLAKEQSWIRLGTVMSPAPGDRPALEVATLLLSDRMNAELRERHGLAYSVGASLGTTGDRAWLTAGMGTRPENVARAEAGLVAAIRDLGGAAVSAEDVTRVVKAHQGRQRMRRVTRINQAQVLALEAMAGDPLGKSAADLAALTTVRADDVTRVARATFGPAPLVTAIAR